jgi:hypothetical protein
MRRLALSVLMSVAVLAVAAPAALAQNSGEGTYGEAGDLVVTNAGFILIAAFPLFIFLMSLLQWRLDKRKAAKKKAAKAAGGARRWEGGW